MLTPADPRASYLAHKDALDQAIRQVMEGGAYILGPQVSAFEQRFAAYLGVAHCIGVANGTDAVQLALRAVGVQPGDMVITVSHTAVATVSAIDWIGAIPVLVDIDPGTYTIDPQKVEDTLRHMSTGQVKALAAVHLYGHPADMAALTSIAARHGVALVEDCAQAHGAMIGERKAGAMGTCGTFSFYPTKNLGAFGDAGAIATSDAGIAEKLRLLQQYGWRQRYISAEAGYNSRLDELQAAILDCKLTWLDGWNERRREIAGLYDNGLAGLPLECPVERPGCRHVYHQYVIRCPERDALRRHLERQGIHTAILYPVPVHQQEGYRSRVVVAPSGLAVSEAIAQEILCLPIYPELPNADVQRVIDELRAFWT
jgi:dTDP-4-amino-4,6-dideoxygalactose transaminase